MSKHPPRDPVVYLVLRGLEATIDDFQESLKHAVCSSIRATPDVTHAALVAADMIDAAFKRLPWKRRAA